MGLCQHIALLVIGILVVADAKFYITAPSTLRLNTDELIGIVFEDGSERNAQIQVKSQTESGTVVFTDNVVLKPGEPKIAKIKLDIAQFPDDFFTTPGPQRFVVLIVSSTRRFRKAISIPVTSQYGYMFIQSDKPIYTPLERASFRIIPLNEDGLPSNERFQFQLRNPDGIVVDEKLYTGRRREPKYFVTHPYPFHMQSYPKLGKWTAVVLYGNNFELNSTLSFHLDEYVLPTFIVTITSPEYILPDAETITVSVEAKHTYGKYVNGIVSFRFGLMREHSTLIDYFLSFKQVVTLVDGCASYALETRHFQTHADAGWFEENEGSTFVVEAIVVEEATGNKVVEKDYTSRLSRTPFLISIKRCLGDFKPGLTSVFEADITYMNGRPAAGIATKLTAIADNTHKLNIVRSTAESDENGKVSFKFHPEQHHKEVVLTLETAMEEYGPNQARGECVQKAFQSKNNAYLAISRGSDRIAKPDEFFQRDVYFEPDNITNVYYLVLARGRIQLFNKITPGSFKVYTIYFLVTHKMVPSFRVVVFTQHNNEFLADSLKIDVEKVCSPEAEVKLEANFEDTEPATKGKITMRGARGTSVGLFGVDKAVYAQAKSDILIKEKLLDEFATHDLGCGPGGGLNVNSVLGNAGIMIVTDRYTSSYSHSCAAIIRRKRSTVETIVNRYTGREQVCCGLGLRNDRYGRMCVTKEYKIRKVLVAIHENCSQIFLECCKEGEKQDVTDAVYFPTGRNHPGNGRDIRVLSPDKIAQIERDTTVRKEFKQTWFNNDYTIGPNNYTEDYITLPHSITTWIIQAVSVSPTHGVCVSDPQTAVSFKKVFLQINAPYSIQQYEQVEIQATVFNYDKQNITARVRMHEAFGICTESDSNKYIEKTVKIKANSSRTVSFPVIPLLVEPLPISFFVYSNTVSDKIEKKLNVVPRGKRKFVTVERKLDPTNFQRRGSLDVISTLFTDSIDQSQNIQVISFTLSFPVGTVPGTATCVIRATGDPVGPAVETTLSNPDALIRLPKGCGEQNMVKLAPTIYTLRYLNSTNKLTPPIREKAFRFIRAGYSNQLNYKKDDGSYAIWQSSPSSTWLTAFVMKVFCQGTKFIPLDENVINSGIQWLQNKQKNDGSFHEENIVRDRRMMGGVQGDVSMTAYALIALEECKTTNENILFNLLLSESRRKARIYLETKRNTVNSPLTAAILAYALALSNSSEMVAANRKLLSLAKRDANANYMYWITNNTARDIETAGYALLTQLLMNDTGRSTSIVNWLNSKQSNGGSFRSTQDTVIALQSLSEFAPRAPSAGINLVSTLTSSSDRNLTKIFTFNDSNALIPQSVTIEKPEGKIFVTTSGTGIGTISMELQYNVLKPTNETCKFHINTTITVVDNFDGSVAKAIRGLDEEPDRRRKKRQTFDAFDMEDDVPDKLVYNLSICLRYLGKSHAEMSIADVGIFSGFEAHKQDLKKLQDDPNHLIDKYENSSRNITFYLKSVPRTHDYCFSFRIMREFVVGNTQSSVIKVYEYYNPDVCTKFYSPNKDSAELQKICTGDLCVCAEGACPPRSLPDSIIKEEDMDKRRENIKNRFCIELSYVWLGKLGFRQRNTTDGYLHIPFNITRVIKHGTENANEILNRIRVLKVHKYCDAALLDEATYLIAGKDPVDTKTKQDIVNGYILDKNSLIHHWVLVEYSNTKRIQEDLEYVILNMKEDGCG